MHVLNVNAKCDVFSIYMKAHFFWFYDAMYLLYCIDILYTLCKCMHVGGAACTPHKRRFV